MRKAQVEVEGLLHAAVEHAQPVGGGLLQVGSAEQVACLHDDLEGVAEVVGELAHLDREILRNLGHGSIGLGGEQSGSGILIGHE